MGVVASSVYVVIPTNQPKTRQLKMQAPGITRRPFVNDGGPNLSLPEPTKFSAFSPSWEAEEQILLAEGEVPEPPRGDWLNQVPVPKQAAVVQQPPPRIVASILTPSPSAVAPAPPRKVALQQQSTAHRRQQAYPETVVITPIQHPSVVLQPRSISRRVYPQPGHLLDYVPQLGISAEYPALSSVCTTEVEASDVESMLSSASEVESLGDAWDAMEVAKIRGGVVGICESLSEFDFMCPHCVSLDVVNAATETTTTTDRVYGPIVCFSCCPRRAHYSCMVRNSAAHELARHNVPACLECLRPSDLAPHQHVVQRYANQLPAKTPVIASSSNTSSNAGGRISSLWARYDTLSTHLRQQGLIKGMQEFVASTDRSKPPCLDAERIMQLGIDMRGLLAAGWSLETIVAEFKLWRLDDPAWTQLRFNRNILLELGEADLVFFMQTFNLHPYEVRRDFQIRKSHLWRSAQQRRMAGRGSSDGRSPAESGSMQHRAAYENDLSKAVSQRFQKEQRAIQNAKTLGANRRMLATDEVCSHYGFIKPRCLAILGFNVHHLLVMGFDKTHFQNFGYYTMHDWVFHLGFRKSHWERLRLHKNDFGGRGVFANLTGWNTDVLLKRWKITPNERYAMGLLTDLELEEGTRPTPPPPITKEPMAQRQARESLAAPRMRYMPHREPGMTRRPHPSRAMRQPSRRSRHTNNQTQHLRHNYGI